MHDVSTNQPARVVAAGLAVERAWIVQNVELEHLVEVLGCADVAAPLAGVPIACTDMKDAAAAAHAAKRVLVADNSCATLAISDPCRRGADIHFERLDWITHSQEGLTEPHECKPVAETLSGSCTRGCDSENSCVLVGVSSSCSSEAAARLASYMAGCTHPSRELQLKIADERDRAIHAMRQACDVARVVAAYLVCHPAVRAVIHPSLASDPSCEPARRALHHGFGRYIDFLLDGGAYLTTRARAENTTNIKAQVQKQLLNDRKATIELPVGLGCIHNLGNIQARNEPQASEAAISERVAAAFATSEQPCLRLVCRTGSCALLIEALEELLPQLIGDPEKEKIWR